MAPRVMGEITGGDVQIEGGDINEILRFVASKSPVGDVQLTLLAYAYATGCRACQIDRKMALAQIEAAIDGIAKSGMVPLWHS